VERERQRDLAVVALVLDPRIEMAEKAYFSLVAEADDIPLREFFCRSDQRLPARTIEPFDQRGIDLRFGVTADAAAGQLRRDHPGIVDHELIAVPKQLRQVGDDTILRRLARLHHQHPCGIARIRGTKRDAGGGKFEVE
jgi:hypothetical protein